jgi:hypothetical protein
MTPVTGAEAATVPISVTVLPISAGAGGASLPGGFTARVRLPQNASAGDRSYGDPADPANILGPQMSAAQRDRVMSYIQNGIDEGASLALGGRRPCQLSV